MLRIAVCDDDERELNQTTGLIEAYLQSRHVMNGQIEPFPSGAALLAQTAEAGNFDLYVLDILMPELSGIETGRQLRALRDGGEIIYLTSSNDFAADSYDVRAYFYLLKPVEEDKLFRVLDGVMDKLKKRRSSAIVVNTTNGLQRLLMEDIRYAERVGRCIRYYGTNGTIESQSVRSSFRDMVAPLLDDPRFYLCGASFVLNFQHVAGVNGQTALLDNGQTVALPRTAATAFKMAWGSYWLGENSQ